MTIAIRALTILTLSGLVGCSLAEPDDAPDADLEGRAGNVFAQACPATRQIAETMAPGHCPNVQGWVGRSLFERGAPWLINNDITVPDETDRYCRYDFDASEPPGLIQAVANLRQHEGLIEVGPDCEVVFGEAQSVLAEAVAPVMRDLFRAAIGRPSAEDLLTSAGNSTEGDRATVEVAVVDTMPSTLPRHPRSKHGETMARIISDVACPDTTTSCAVGIERILGLPRHRDGIDFVHGGYVGSQGDLAAGIIETVHRYRQQVLGGATHAGLVINLSVGWEPGLFGGGSIDNPTPVDAVQLALEYASCHGALIIAAAGNESSVCTTGALAPAMWEELPAPDAVRCAELGAPIPPVGGLYRPLVYAVGGLDFDGEPLPGARDDGMPRLAAAASHAVASEPQTKALSGTSVSAAVASGIAALVWSYRFDLTAHEVMDFVYEGASDVNLTASFSGPGVPDTAVVAAHGCNALAAACDVGAVCPDLALACAVSPEPADLGLVSAAVDGMSVLPKVVQRSFDPATACGLHCGQDVEALGFDGADACATTYVDPTDRFVNPQPNDPACSVCTLRTATTSVSASLDPEYKDFDVTNVSVTVFDAWYNETRYDFGDVDLTVDDVNELLLDPPPVAAIGSSSISITFAELTRPVENYLISI